MIVRHTITVNDTVVTIVATSIIRTALMPNCTITRPATAGDMRYCAAAASWVIPEARAYCSGVSRSVTVAR